MSQEHFEHFLFGDNSADFENIEKKGIVYSRHSSNKQNPESSADQIRTCKRQAKMDGIEILESYCRTDEAKSGTKLNGREGLLDIMKIVESGRAPFKYLYVESTSRLGRSMRDVMRVVQLLDHSGIVISFTQQNLRTDEMNFKMFLAIYAIIDEYFITQLAANTRRGLVELIGRGKNPGKSPYGYISRKILSKATPTSAEVDEGSILEQVPELLQIVLEIYQMRLNEGLSAKKIACRLHQRLREEGFPPPPTGDLWRVGHVRTILGEPLYKGEMIWGRTTTVRHPETGKVEQRPAKSELIVHHPFPELAIMSPDLWDAVQKTFPQERRKLGRRPKHMDKTTRLLTGLVICAECGSRMVNPFGGKFGYYVCQRRHEHGDKECSNDARIPRDRFETIAIREVERWLCDVNRVNRQASQIRDAVDRHILKEYIDPKRHDLSAKLNRLRDERSKIAAMLEAGDISESGVEILANLDKKISSVEDQEAMPDLKVMPDLTKYLSNDELLRHYQEKSTALRRPETAKATLMELIETFKVSPTENGARAEISENSQYIEQLAIKLFFAAVTHGKYPSGTLLSLPVSPAHSFDVPIIERRQKRLDI